MTRHLLLAIVAVAAAVLTPSPAGAAEPTVADLFSSARAIRVVGDVAYTVTTAGLVVYDVSDRSNPRQVSQLLLDRVGSFRLAVQGDYAYVLSGEIVFEPAILRVVNVRDPNAPVLVGEFTDLLPDSRAQQLLVTGTTVAIGDGNAVTLVDVSDPASPTKLSRLPIVSDPEQIVGLAVNGSTLFATWLGLGGDQPTGGVTSIDISDPAAPAQLGVFAVEGSPSSMSSVGDTLYVGETFPTDVVVIDASDPANMAEAARIDFPLTGSVDVYAEGDRLFTGASTDDFLVNRIGVHDISNPRAPQSLQETRLPRQVPGMDYDQSLSDVFLPGSLNSGLGLAVYDLTAAGALEPIASVDVPEIRDVEVTAAGWTLLATSQGLLAVEGGEGGRVEVLGRLDLEPGAYRTQIVGDRAYVLTANDTIARGARVRIVDVTDPASMSELGSIELEDLGIVYTSKRFFAVENRLYLTQPEGLFIYDVTNPATPVELGSFETPSPAENVIVSGDLAFVNTIRFEDNLLHVDLYVVKVKKPNKPKLRGKRLDVDAANYVSDMAIRDGRLYMLVAGQGVPFGVAGDGRILAVDVSKKSPRVASEGPTSPSGNGYARELQLVGDLAYVADGLDGVTILSIAGTDAPSFVRAIETPGYAGAVWVGADGTVSVADLNSFQVYAPEGIQ